VGGRITILASLVGPGQVA